MQERIMGNKIRNTPVLYQEVFQQSNTEKSLKLNKSPLQIVPLKKSLTLTATAVGKYPSFQI